MTSKQLKQLLTDDDKEVVVTLCVDLSYDFEIKSVYTHSDRIHIDIEEINPKELR